MAKAKTPARRRGGSPKPQVAAATTVNAVTQEPAAAKPRTSPIQFINQVRAEGRKITWPSRKETWITSVMVFIMVVLAAVFFYVVDTLMGLGINALIQIGR